MWPQWSQIFTIFHENSQDLKHYGDNTKQGPWSIVARSHQFTTPDIYLLHYPE